MCRHKRWIFPNFPWYWNHSWLLLRFPKLAHCAGFFELKFRFFFTTRTWWYLVGQCDLKNISTVSVQQHNQINAIRFKAPLLHPHSHLRSHPHSHTHSHPHSHPHFHPHSHAHSHHIFTYTHQHSRLHSRLHSHLHSHLHSYPHFTHTLAHTFTHSLSLSLSLSLSIYLSLSLSYSPTRSHSLPRYVFFENRRRAQTFDIWIPWNILGPLKAKPIHQREEELTPFFSYVR
jgi:hypothetical protein